MGCCKSHSRDSVNQEKLSIKVKAAIEHSRTKQLISLLKIFEAHSKETRFIEACLIKYSRYRFNALSYSAYIGNSKMFCFILSKGASIEITEKLLESQGIRLINLLCSRNKVEILSVYLPIYVSYKKEPTNNSYTIEFNSTSQNTFELPIHSACRSRSFEAVHYLFTYFNDYVPREFDVHTLSDYFEENSGFIACRAGSFQLVKYLNEKCKVDFKRQNKFKENTLMACVSGSLKKNEFGYLECISYLVEYVKVDITYMHEELLYLAENDQIIKYLEFQLEKVGIKTKKKDLNPHSRRSIEVRLDSKTSFVDNNFCVEASKSNSFVSSIESCFSNSPSWADELDPLISKS